MSDKQDIILNNGSANILRQWLGLPGLLSSPDDFYTIGKFLAEALPKVEPPVAAASDESLMRKWCSESVAFAVSPKTIDVVRATLSEAIKAKKLGHNEYTFPILKAFGFSPD